jgi:hypothetical protein
VFWYKTFRKTEIPSHYSQIHPAMQAKFQLLVRSIPFIA